MVAKLSALLVGYHAPTVRAPDCWYTRKRELVPRSTSPGFNTWRCSSLLRRRCLTLEYPGRCVGVRHVRVSKFCLASYIICSTYSDEKGVD
jgi:hypothetical protein